MNVPLRTVTNLEMTKHTTEHPVHAKIVFPTETHLEMNTHSHKHLASAVLFLKFKYATCTCTMVFKETTGIRPLLFYS